MSELVKEPFDMARQRQRVCLQAGLKLDLNSFARRGLIQLGAFASQVCK